MFKEHLEVKADIMEAHERIKLIGKANKRIKSSNHSEKVKERTREQIRDENRKLKDRKQLMKWQD